MNRATVALVAVLLFGLNGQTSAGDPKAGEEKAAACLACHGAGGGAPISPQYPILAGQYENYLSAALRQYQSGARKNMIMSGLAAALSEEDIEDLAAYFASQSSPLRIID